AGTQSAQAGAYYAGRGNKFWRILHETGLTPRQLAPQEFPTLPGYGLGLTDLAKHTFGGDLSLKKSDFDAAAFHERILKAAPRVVAFNGKKAAQMYYGRNAVSYGRQADLMGETVVFVLPSTSGAANGAWDAVYWHELAAFVQASS
ncbi:MAG: mismatch-specific DNA-glycosylase, partial [Anaerolineae bacterium]|nr:mismatch-specific DNA-glycosylase [Anaerolineae bacterium]